MRFSALSLIGITALLVAAEPATARDGCGRGMAWNGYACVQRAYQAPVVQFYREPSYGAYGYSGGYQRQNVVRGGQCPRGYTIQHGRCEPYRGR
jgi:hypothetical protein